MEEDDGRLLPLVIKFQDERQRGDERTKPGGEVGQRGRNEEKNENRGKGQKRRRRVEG